MTTSTAAPTGPDTDEIPTEEDDTRTWREQCGDAARNRVQNARVRARIEASRAGTGLKSAVWRNRRQLEPLKLTAAPLATGGLGAALAQNPEVSELAAAGGTGAVAAAGAVGAWFWLRQRLATRWVSRVQLGLGGGAAWAGCAPFVDTLQGGAGMGLALLAGSVGLSASYWQHHRPGYPDRPATVEDVQDEEPTEDVEPDLPAIVANWNANVAKKNGALPGATIRDNGSITNGESYRVQLSAGDQTLGSAQSSHEKISGGLRVNPQKLLIESAGTDDPNDLELRVVRNSPITGTVYFDQPEYRTDASGNGFVTLGPYADGEGAGASYALYGPNSMFGGYVLGATRSGKSRLIESVGVTALSEQAPPTVLVYLDGQDGASSAALWENALWRGGPDRAVSIAEGLLRMMRYREKYIRWRRKHGGGGFVPSDETPGVLVVVDEGDAIFKLAGQLFADLARRGGKSGFGVLAASQVVDLTAFGTGGDALRSSLVSGNGIAMKTNSNVQGTVFPGLSADLTQLPPYGYGYTTSGGKDVSHRVAQFRTRFLPDQGDLDRLAQQGTPAPDGVFSVEQWMAHVADGQELSEDMGAAAGDIYTRRHEIAEAEDEDLDALFGDGGDPSVMFAGDQMTASENTAEKDATVTSLFSGGFGDLAETRAPQGVPARELKPREQQVIDLLTSYEELSVAQLAEELDITDRAVRNVIRGLESRLTRVRSGVYRLA